MFFCCQILGYIDKIHLRLLDFKITQDNTVSNQVEGTVMENTVWAFITHKQLRCDVNQITNIYKLAESKTVKLSVYIFTSHVMTALALSKQTPAYYFFTIL